MATRKYPKARTWKQERCFVIKGRLTSVRENLRNMVGRPTLTKLESDKLKCTLDYLNSILDKFDSSTIALENEVNPK